MNQANFVNGNAGSIFPSCFVVPDSTAPKAVNQATAATSFIVGVSAEYSKYPPLGQYPTVGNVLADAPGDPLLVYQETDECYLNATSAGWTQGSLLTSNSQGYGVAATGTQFYGELALTTMTGTGLGQVKIVTGQLG